MADNTILVLNAGSSSLKFHSFWPRSGGVLPRLKQDYLATYSYAMSVASVLAMLSAIASGMIALSGIVFAIAFVMDAIESINFYDAL